MKKFRDFMCRKIDWILILTGSLFLSYNIFNYSIKGGKPLRLLGGGSEKIYAFAYYYPGYIKILIAFSVVLIVFGILIRKER